MRTWPATIIMQDVINAGGWTLMWNVNAKRYAQRSVGTLNI